MEDNIIVSIGRTLAKPWREDISPMTAVIVFVLFAIAVWWALDSLRIISKMHKFVADVSAEVA